MVATSTEIWNEKRALSRSRTRADAGWVTLVTCWAQAEAGRMISKTAPIVSADAFRRCMSATPGGPAHCRASGSTARCPRSASPGLLDRGDVDLLHRHHRVEGALGLAAAGRERVGQDARRDLPGQAPAVLAPAAIALLAAVLDDRVPVAVRLVLVVRGDLEG